MLEAIFFDLDGTLADSAPDLGGALNRVREEEGLTALSAHLLRPVVSQGVRGLLRVGFGIDPDDGRYTSLQERVLEHYEKAICNDTLLFDGVSNLLSALEETNIPWGVITNKRARYTQPLMNALGLEKRAACIVSGDSAPRSKPAPDPILLACQLTRVTPANCWYVGDDLRDIQAAHAAGMPAAAAAYGYLGENPDVTAWEADAVINHPLELLSIINSTNSAL